MTKAALLPLSWKRLLTENKHLLLEVDRTAAESESICAAGGGALHLMMIINNVTTETVGLKMIF